MFLPPGTFGSFVFANAMSRGGVIPTKVIVRRNRDAACGRKHGPAEVMVSGYASRLPTACCPLGTPRPPTRSYVWPMRAWK